MMAKVIPFRTQVASAESKAKRQRQDTDFLPAALEILETPASPIRTVFLWLICILAASVILWCYLGKIDIVATAQGKVQPIGRVKVVQSLETGKVVTIKASNGVSVNRGDVLIELDDTEVKAEQTALVIKRATLRSEIIRRQAVLAAIELWQRDGDLWETSIVATKQELTFRGEIPAPIRQREQRNYQAELAKLRASIDSLAAQRSKTRAEIDRLDASIAVQEALVTTLAERSSMRSRLVEVRAGSKADLLETRQILQEAEVDLTTLVGQRAEAQAAMAVLQGEATELLETSASDNVQRQSDAMRQVDELEQELIKIQRRRRLMTITSPIDGVVQASAVTTLGQVVAAGTDLMRIVPDDATLEIEAYLPNRDIGFVAKGQQAVIKIEAFPFTRYGILNGRVTRVAADAVPEPDARKLEGDPASELNSIVPVSNTQRMQNLVFPITVRPDAPTISVGGKDVPLSPGMAATVEIKTGQRRILEYLFSPLAEIGSQAMKER